MRGFGRRWRPQGSARRARRTRPRLGALVVVIGVTGGVLPSMSSAWGAAPTGAGDCSAGAHSLGSPGDDLYPETGNGGYVSVHTDVNLFYDVPSNRFLPGTTVSLTDQASQCLSSFSLDFETSSADTLTGPALSVSAVTVNAVPATFAFVQPTYPGDPAGQDDPDPAAHQVGQGSVVGGPAHNALPPACSPELATRAVVPSQQDGQPCPATKLVITPPTPIADGASFTVVVSYSGRPGVHHDGDGSVEGWMRTRDGGFVITEPVGAEDWMPLNDFPSAKPTYDVYDTVNRGSTALANGLLVSRTINKASASFPAGSVTWHWRSTAPVASYLVESTVGRYSLSHHLGSDGITFYDAQDRAISATAQKANAAVMAQQQDITDFEAGFSGPYPFSSNGIVIGTAKAGFAEEMQTMLAFPNGTITTDLLYHENMHEWWGDNVSESGYEMTFYKEGLATLAEELYAARLAETAAGGPGSAAGPAAFEASLVAQFNAIYGTLGTFWTAAPSRPSTHSLYAVASTYQRPGAAFIALRAILGPANFENALAQIQRSYGGGSIDEVQLEAAFASWLPVPGSACSQRLTDFFLQWFDTAYAVGGGANSPQITGPGLAGPDFYDANGGCS